MEFFQVSPEITQSPSFHYFWDSSIFGFTHLFMGIIDKLRFSTNACRQALSLPLSSHLIWDSEHGTIVLFRNNRDFLIDGCSSHSSMLCPDHHIISRHAPHSPSTQKFSRRFSVHTLMMPYFKEATDYLHSATARRISYLPTSPDKYNKNR